MVKPRLAVGWNMVAGARAERGSRARGSAPRPGAATVQGVHPAKHMHTHQHPSPPPPARAQPPLASQAERGEGRASQQTPSRLRRAAGRPGRCGRACSSRRGHWRGLRALLRAASTAWGLSPAPSRRSPARTDPGSWSSQRCPAWPGLPRSKARVSRHLPRGRLLATAHLPKVGGGEGRGEGRGVGGRKRSLQSEAKTGLEPLRVGVGLLLPCAPPLASPCVSALEQSLAAAAAVSTLEGAEGVRGAGGSGETPPPRPGG